MGIPRRVATMTAYDSIERGAADECEPLRGRRSRTFTLTHLLVACGAVCVCAIAATTVVNTHLANFDDVSALSDFDDGSAFDDDSALANFDDDYPEGAQLGQGNLTDRQKRCLESYARRYKFAVEANCGSARRKICRYVRNSLNIRRRICQVPTCNRRTIDGWYNRQKQSCTTPSPPPSPPPPPPPPPLGPYVRTVLPKGPLSRSSACYYPRGFYYRYSSRWKDCEEKCNQCGDCIGVSYNGRLKRCYFARGGTSGFRSPTRVQSQCQQVENASNK